MKEVEETAKYRFVAVWNIRELVSRWPHIDDVLTLLT